MPGQLLKRIRQLAAIALACAFILVSGCASIVSKMITRQVPSPSAVVVSRAQLVEQGFATDKFCSARHGICISYLTAAAMVSAQSLSYAVEIENGGPHEHIKLSMSRAAYPAVGRGTVVLLHGFRSSKEFMTNSALYFRFLGFDVLVPDLPGHGESGGSIRFGPSDSDVLSELLDTHAADGEPVYLFANSMGAIAATYLATSRHEVRGLILQAPMPIFDVAAENYFAAHSPMLTAVLTRSSIRTGALKALRSANVSLRQTDIRPLIASLHAPVLVLVSPADPVSQLSYFAPLASDTVTVLPVDARTHAGMAVIGDIEGAAVREWLHRQ